MAVRDRDETEWGKRDGRDAQYGRCEVLQTRDAGRMPTDGVDGIDKMRDGNEQMR